MNKNRDFFWYAITLLFAFALGILAGGIVGVSVGTHNVRSFEVAPLQAQLEIVFDRLAESSPLFVEICDKLDAIIQAVEREAGHHVEAVRVRIGGKEARK
jgi:hypothetical protein